jgi:hypothetical protein
MVGGNLSHQPANIKACITIQCYHCKQLHHRMKATMEHFCHTAGPWCPTIWNEMHVQIFQTKESMYIIQELSIYLSILYVLCCKFTRKHIYIHIVQNMYIVLACSLPPRTCYCGPPMFHAWEEEGWALEIWQGEFCPTPPRIWICVKVSVGTISSLLALVEKCPTRLQLWESDENSLLLTWFSKETRLLQAFICC